MSDFARRILVHWNDCDPARIVFHAHFIRWMDEGFTELARACGVVFAQMRIWGIAGAEGRGLLAMLIPEAIAARVRGDPN